MLNLDPGKLLVIGVVAIILLGPDRLPQVAKQIGGAWRTFNEFRHRMETQVRDTMPDLPDTSEIARLARSPSALLNHLSNMAADEEPDGSFEPPDVSGENGTTPAGAETNGSAHSLPDTNGSAPPADAAADGSTGGQVESAPDALRAPEAPPAPFHVERPPRTPEPQGSEPSGPKSSGVVVPGDPTLN